MFYSVHSPSMQVGAARPLRYRLASGLVLAADGFGDVEMPTVLLLHGGGQTRHAWGKTAERLASAGFHAIALDLRGHGESDWDPEGRYEAPSFASDIGEVLDQLPRPPVLVGASLGGIASLLAEGSDAPHRTKGLVLVDVTPRLSLPGVTRILDFMRARPEGFATLDEVAEAVARYVPHRKPPKDTAGLERNLRKGTDGRYRWHWDPKLLETWDPDRYTPEMGRAAVAERLACAARVRVPMLLVRGRMSDVVSEENARELLEMAPSTEYVDLADAAHMVAGDVNDAFTETVIDFVQRAHQR
jgi:pimeloyl-ACP methyl ester carboxylesterase